MEVGITWKRLALDVLAAVAVYEVVRFVVVGQVKRWLRKGAIRFVRQHKVKLESARFIDRVWMRERLAWDPEVEAAIIEAARRTGEPIPLLRDKVDAYVEEIAPYFSLSTYYQFGAAIAKRFVNFCYEMVVDEDGFERQARAVPEGAVRVYVINHRSNFDPLILAFGLVHRVAMSYAVGEWALVWPLSALFRAFGSYFVRRGESDPLYHAVLERFVQLLAGHGAITGFFIEGGLTRDGMLRRPRTGLLEYLVKLRKEFPDRDIVFMPVGLNYDRVLEDRYLVRERNGPVPRQWLVLRLWNLVAIAFWLPILVAANVLRVATRSHQKFGYAAIAFGEPMRLSEFPGGQTVHLVSPAERKIVVEALATELLYKRIGAAIPVTPIGVTCLALGRSPETDGPSMVAKIRQILAELRNVDAPIAFGDAFASIEARRDDPSGDSGMGGVEQELLDVEEAELVLRLSSQQLTRRLVLRRKEGKLEVLPEQQPVIEFYANAIVHHLDPDVLTRREDAAPTATAPAIPRRTGRVVE